MNTIVEGDGQVLSHLSQSSLKDLEYAVAEMRGSYPQQIEALESNRLQHNLDMIKKYNPSPLTSKDSCNEINCSIDTSHILDQLKDSTTLLKLNLNKFEAFQRASETLQVLHGMKKSNYP
ncbi:uncharacterized protein LOC143461646 [Clavelina lepadiformis]|uniref:uncharacterized protein LOC143461646 n=1 Tax=Clavelina lepadiformis TaxID=159417 RepID=UPI004043638A